MASATTDEAPPRPGPGRGRVGTLPPARAGTLSVLPVALLVFLLALVAVAPGGEDVAAPGPPSPSFEEAFEPDGRLALEEPDSAVVAEVRDVDVRDDGALAVADARSDRVRVYAADGTLVADVGGSGSGPGELDGPVTVAFDDRGGLLVGEIGSVRITRYDRDFAYDTAFRVDSAVYPSEIGVTGGHAVVYVKRRGEGAVSLRHYDARGRVVKNFHPRRAAYRAVPYWNAVAGHRLAVSESHIVAGGNLLYPFARYGPDGTLRDSIGSPPPSWEPAPRPERGEFMGPGHLKRFQRWRRTFTTVDALAIYRDSLLVVAHEELDPEVVAYEDAAYRADVYRIDTREKLLQDVPLPGRLLHGGRHLWVLESSPPGPWTLGRYHLASGGIQP